jgi:hypothetical protein
MDALAKMLPDLPPVTTRGGSAQGKKEDDVAKPVRKCARCGEIRTIQGRGKCGSCYHKELKEEREIKRHLDDKQVDEPDQECAASASLETAPRVEIGPDDSEALPRVDVLPVEECGHRTDESDAGQDRFVSDLDKVLGEIRVMLVNKNRAYGNAVIDPLRVFSKADRIEQINVRMDDKLSRMVRGKDAGEDPELDLLGYMIIKRVALLEDHQ